MTVREACRCRGQRTRDQQVALCAVLVGREQRDPMIFRMCSSRPLRYVMDRASRRPDSQFQRAIDDRAQKGPHAASLTLSMRPTAPVPFRRPGGAERTQLSRNPSAASLSAMTRRMRSTMISVRPVRVAAALSLDELAGVNSSFSIRRPEDLGRICRTHPARELHELLPVRPVRLLANRGRTPPGHVRGKSEIFAIWPSEFIPCGCVSINLQC